MTGVAAASFFSNACRFGSCGLHFESLAELIVHIEDNHIVWLSWESYSHELSLEESGWMGDGHVLLDTPPLIFSSADSKDQQWKLPAVSRNPRVLEKQELQQPTYVALSYINRFMTEAARREQENQKKKVQPKLALSATGESELEWEILESVLC
ncbi:hypothetical protein P4O66_003626 [Electrophorus voltai]|uniref:C2H2-type domain-containing protein n=1 Tax=Electrophorus voltai TaxID=2609070 RepID=A0AAD8ZSU4_9TELE|nr:hypothetical protein P4O66_003626 [Electrophorus voltai]